MPPLTRITPDRGTKRICAGCACRFYDLARTPAVCPKCGAEYVEPVRAAPAYRPRQRGRFGTRNPASPDEPGNGGHADAREPSEDDERESGDEGEEEFGAEGEHESEDEGAP